MSTEDKKQDETKEVLKNNEEVKQTEATEVEADPIETRAREQGWRPKEEWEGDQAEWRDARSFLDRGELLTRISGQSKEIKELRKTLKAFEDLNKKLAETKFNEKLTELKTAKKEALEAGDAARVVELDEQIDITRDAIAENKASTVAEESVSTPEIHPDFQRWMDRNSWYGQNQEMREMADQIGTSYARANKGKAPSEVLAYVEQRIKKAYPENFANARREEASKVEAGGGTRKMTTRKGGMSVDDLPAEARSVMQTLVRSGTMTQEEYLKQYALTERK